MTVNACYQNEILHIRLCGEMDEHTASYARREADSLATRYVACKCAVFDLRDVSFMDSTGIGFLIGRYKKIQRYGMSMYIESPNFTADKVLAVSGIYTLIPKL